MDQPSNWRRFNLQGLVFDFDMSKVGNTFFHTTVDMATDIPDIYADGMYHIRDLGISPQELISALEFLIKVDCVRIIFTVTPLSGLQKLLLPTYLTYDMALQTQSELLDYTHLSEGITIAKPNNLLFASKSRLLTFLSEKDSLTVLETWKYLLVSPHLALVGRSVFQAIVGQPVKDVTLCVHGCDRETADQALSQLFQSLTITVLNYEKDRIRATVAQDKSSFQLEVITCLYPTLAAAVIDSDIDCECLAYDGRNLWLSPRAVFALKGQFNTVNLNICKQGYADRLLGYVNCGMMIHDAGYVPSNYNMGDTLQEQSNSILLYTPEKGNLNFLVFRDRLESGAFDKIGSTGPTGPAGPPGSTYPIGEAGQAAPISFVGSVVVWCTTTSQEAVAANIRQKWYDPPVPFEERYR